jgi:hypothetical protein
MNMASDMGCTKRTDAHVHAIEAMLMAAARRDGIAARRELIGSAEPLYGDAVGSFPLLASLPLLGSNMPRPK